MRAQSPRGAKLLVVEDSDVQAAKVCQALRDAGYDVARVASAEAALELLNTFTPDLIVSDLHLPQMDGRELTRQLRLNPRTRTVPIVMMTASRAKGNERAGLQSGVDAYYEKGSNLQPLVIRVGALLRRGADEPVAGIPFRRARLLVLGSESANQAASHQGLVRDGFEVAVSRDVENAMEALENTPPDCVIVRLGDAAFDGVAACARFAQVRAARMRDDGAPPFLIVAIGDGSETAEDDVKSAFAAGADDVISVGGDPELLLLRLHALLRRQLMQEEARRLANERANAQAAAEQFRILVQGVVDYAIYMLDSEGRVTTWNAGAERIKGYGIDEIIGQSFTRFYTEADRARGEPQRALEAARTQGRYETESLRVRKSGETFWAHVVIDPIYDTRGQLTGYAKVTRDITERVKAAEELQLTRDALMQAQKMEAIGQLTGGIAHDFNNMLAGIIGGLNLLQRRLDAKRYDDTGALIQAALTSANRAAALTSRLLAFGRRQSLDIKPIDVNATVSSMRMLLERTMGENVSIETRYDVEHVFALTDVSQLESAILNLAINARDAMPSGGALSIRTRTTRLKVSEDPEQPPPGEYAEITVADTGEGMTEEVLKKVFDPFFTTKPIGHGTGLGLSMVYGFVRQSGGHVNIESAPGRGTRVMILLPQSRQAATPAEPTPPVDARGAGESVLVVEDDPQVRMLVREVLKELGYHAIEAADAAEALSVIGSERRIDLIISDVGLPGLDGRQLAEIGRKHRPNVKVLFITGYAQHAAVRSDFLAPGMDMITKPFALDLLAEKVRDMIVGPQRGGSNIARP